MLKKIVVLAGLLILLAVPAVAASGPTVAEQIAGLEKMCTETSIARGERQEKEPLFNRLDTGLEVSITRGQGACQLVSLDRPDPLANSLRRLTDQTGGNGIFRIQFQGPGE